MSARRQFAKYVFVGLTGVVLDMGSLIFLKETAGLTPILAVVINQVFLLSYNFTLNKYWSFRSGAMPSTQLARYLVVAGANYGCSVLAMYVFYHVYGFDYRMVRLLTIAALVGCNFLLYKHWVYSGETKTGITGI